MNYQNRNNSIIPSVAAFAVFVVYTVIVTVVDVKPIGPYDSGVGLGSINKAVADAIGVHMLWYHITNILGILALLIAGFFAVVGVLQLVTRHSIKKVDRDILVLGGFYIVVLACYVLFDKFAINYRPVMLEGELESSYPSSHTMLAICVMSTAMMQIKWKIRDQQVSKMVRAVLAVLIVLLVVGRMLSGVHWFTDIIGGVLLSLVLVSLYYWFVMEAGGPGYAKPAPKRTRSARGRASGTRTAGQRISSPGQTGTRPAGSRPAGSRPNYAKTPGSGSDPYGMGRQGNSERSSRGKSHGRLK